MPPRTNTQDRGRTCAASLLEDLERTRAFEGAVLAEVGGAFLLGAVPCVQAFLLGAVPRIGRRHPSCVQAFLLGAFLLLPPPSPVSKQQHVWWSRLTQELRLKQESRFTQDPRVSCVKVHPRPKSQGSPKSPGSPRVKNQDYAQQFHKYAGCSCRRAGAEDMTYVWHAAARDEKCKRCAWRGKPQHP